MSLKILLFSLLFISSQGVFGQMKRSAYGKFYGTIPSYELSSGKESFITAASNISVQISKTQIFINIGQQHYKGTWRLLMQTKAYYLIEAITESPAPERILIYKKGKKMLREGVSPQPDVMLTKIKD